MSEEAPITASFILTLDEIKKAQALSSSKPGLRQMVIPLVFIVGLSPIVIGVLSHRIRVNTADWTPMKILVLVAGFVILYFFFRYQRNEALKQAFAQNPAANKRLEYRFSPGMVIATVDGVSETQSQWSSYVEVRRTKDGFLFLQSPQFGFWIPHHAFNSKQDADAVAELARKLVPSFVDR
jgi:YcxB-like protein